MHSHHATWVTRVRQLLAATATGTGRPGLTRQWVTNENSRAMYTIVGLQRDQQFGSGFFSFFLSLEW